MTVIFKVFQGIAFSLSIVRSTRATILHLAAVIATWLGKSNGRSRYHPIVSNWGRLGLRRHVLPEFDPKILCQTFQGDQPWKASKSAALTEQPYPQPFNLDYTTYEKILEAQKKIAEKGGSKDIEWRTVTNDTMVEIQIFADYELWSYEALSHACTSGAPTEAVFFEELGENITQDMHEVYDEYAANSERYGKDDASKLDLEREVFRLVDEMHSGAPRDDILHTVSSVLVDWDFIGSGSDSDNSFREDEHYSDERLENR